MATLQATPARPFLIAASAGTAIGFVYLFAGIMADSGPNWFQAHGVQLTIGWILPALFGLHVHSWAKFTTAPDEKLTGRAATLTLFGAGALGLGHLLGGPYQYLAWLGATLVVAASIIMVKLAASAKPKASLVTDDPLTKGDDACWKHIVFSHRFLPIGMLLWWLTYLPFLPDLWTARLFLAAMHVLLIGYGLLSLYGLGHLWVPRFSGVPAIAAGAIKGELHTTLLGLTGITISMLTGMTGLMFVFGPFVFLGFFTYMGVLGANIMRNKSVTHRVTPEYVYVPWTFAAIFWLVSGVLLGLFLNVVPEQLAHIAPGLRWIHIHINLFGGFIMLIMGWATRIFPEVHGAEPPLFSGAMRTAFLLLNISLTIGALAILRDSANSDLFLSAALLTVLGLLFYGVAMRGFLSSRARAEMP